MLHQTFMACGMITLTVVIHSSFMLGAEPLFKAVTRWATNPIYKALVVAGVVHWFFISICIQCWAWATLMLWLGALETLEEAVYFITVSYTTLGYGDVVLAPEWRLLGAFAATNGTIIIGWTTAIVFLVIQMIYEPDKRP